MVDHIDIDLDTIAEKEKAGVVVKDFAIPTLENVSGGSMIVQLRNFNCYIVKTDPMKLHINYDHQNYSFNHDGQLQLKLENAGRGLEWQHVIVLANHRDAKPIINQPIDIPALQYSRSKYLTFRVWHGAKNDK